MSDGGGKGGSGGGVGVILVDVDGEVDVAVIYDSAFIGQRSAACHWPRDAERHPVGDNAQCTECPHVPKYREPPGVS